MAAQPKTIRKAFQVATENQVFLPKGYRKDRRYPLLVALHGMGMTPREFARMLEPLRQLPLILFVPEGVYPFEIRTGDSMRVGRAWYLYTGDEEAFVSSMQKTGGHLDRLIDRVGEEYSVDPERRVLLGFSQGGYFAGYTAIRRASRYKGLVVMGARVKDEVLGGQIRRAKDLRVLVIHGKKDRSVPFSYAERSVAALEDAGLDVKFKPLKEAGHHVTSEGLRATRDWLKKLLW